MPYDLSRRSDLIQLLTTLLYDTCQPDWTNLTTHQQTSLILDDPPSTLPKKFHHVWLKSTLPAILDYVSHLEILLYNMTSPHTCQPQKNPSALSPPIPFFSTTTPPDSHLTHPLFQSLSRFTGIGFVRTKRHHFFFRGVLTTMIQLQSTRGCGHMSGPGSQRFGTGLLWPGQSWQGCKGDSRDTSAFVTSCPIGMSLPAHSFL